MDIKIKKIELPKPGRTICVSDIHGSYPEFKRLLEKVAYTSDDTLILVGDMWLKGKQPRETLNYMIELNAANPNVYALIGNCDWLPERLREHEKAWLEPMPHILDAGDFVFVHAGLKPGSLESQDPYFCMKNDAFMENAPSFDRWIVTGHWPTFNYTHGIASCNPIVNQEKRIIAIDGGMVVKRCGQLNAFIIERGDGDKFSFDSVDAHLTITVTRPQEARGGFNITWLDRFVERISEGAEFSLCRHIATGREIELPNDQLWRDGAEIFGKNADRSAEKHSGALAVTIGTDYWLPLDTGDAVSVILEYSDRFLAKRGGTVGWVWK